MWRQVPLGVFFFKFINFFFRLFNDWASDNVYLQSKQTHKQSKSRRLFLTVFHFLTTFRTVKIPPLKNPPSPMHRSTKNSPFPAPSPNRQPAKNKENSPPSQNPNRNRKNDESGLFASAHDSLNRSGLFSYETVCLNKFY